MDLCSKMVISEYDGKMEPEAFMDCLVYVENVFAHRTVTDEHNVTLIATRFGSYAAIW